MESVKERLIAYLSKKRITKSSFAREVGVSNAFISSIRKSISPEVLQKIKEAFPDLNIEWLMTGEGNMILAESIEGNQIAVAGRDAINNNNHPQTIEELVSIIKKDQEQRDRLIAIIEKLTGNITN